jgi:N-acyl homoserine lactone hydrolase
MAHMADVLAQNKGDIWINHDKVQRETQKLSPQFYE